MSDWLDVNYEELRSRIIDNSPKTVATMFTLAHWKAFKKITLSDIPNFDQHPIPDSIVDYLRDCNLLRYSGARVAPSTSYGSRATRVRPATRERTF
jgi:hypothetical protein